MAMKDYFHLIKETLREWSEDNVSRLAAALAYYTIFSLAPLLIIVIAVAGWFFGQADVRADILEQITGVLGPESAELVEEMLVQAFDPGESLVATVVAVGILLFGASGVFAELQGAMNTIWEVAAKPGRGILGTLRDRLLSFTMVLAIGFLLLVSLTISAALSALGTFFSDLLPFSAILMHVITTLVSFGIITLLFALMFKVIPDVEIAWRDVWIGAAITALLFTLGKYAIGLYLGSRAVATAFGAAGSLVIILLWVYYSAQIFLLGAEFTQVYANRFGSRILPAEQAVPLSEEARLQQGIPHRETVEALVARSERGASEQPEPAQESSGERKPNYWQFAGLGILFLIVLGRQLRGRRG